MVYDFAESKQNTLAHFIVVWQISLNVVDVCESFSVTFLCPSWFQENVFEKCDLKQTYELPSQGS